jgi:hypothetical protein
LKERTAENAEDSERRGKERPLPQRDSDQAARDNLTSGCNELKER